MEVAGLVNGVREVACMLSCFMHGTELRGAVSTSRVLPSPNADYRYLRRCRSLRLSHLFFVDISHRAQFSTLPLRLSPTESFGQTWLSSRRLWCGWWLNLLPVLLLTLFRLLGPVIFTATRHAIRNFPLPFVKLHGLLRIDLQEQPLSCRAARRTQSIEAQAFVRMCRDLAARGPRNRRIE